MYLLNYLLLGGLLTTGTCTIFYAKAGAEDGDGSWTAPFGSIQECVNAAGGGDECQIRAGRYHEEVEVTGVRGWAQQPTLIKGYGDERPLLDGTVEIKPKAGEWQIMGDIYYGEIEETIWQLFYDDLMMTNARWPNAKWSDKTVFDGTNHWAKTSKNSEKGKIISLNDDLKDSGLDMTGAIGILNIGAWNSFMAKVDHHTPGSNEFTYTDTFGNYPTKWKHSKYYLEDKLDLLDAPEEWFFNKDTKVLYFIPPVGKTFTGATSLRGKVMSYAMKISDSYNVEVKNIDFFGTTVKAAANRAARTGINGLRFDSLNFNYPCASKRMLQEVSLPECMVVDGTGRDDGKMWINKRTYTFFNNTFHGADGKPLAYSGSHITLQNNLFEYNDWTSTNSLVADGGHATVGSHSINDVIIRNTLRNNGDGVGLRPGRENAVVAYNDISGTCFGMQRLDGTAIQLAQRAQTNSTVTHNWVHDSPKYGIRFDGQPPAIGTHGTMKYNVAFRLDAGGLQPKGDYHEADHNLAFDTMDGTVRQFPGCSLCLWKYVRQNPGETNAHSVATNNLADTAHGGRKFNFDTGKLIQPEQVYPLHGAIIKNNQVTPDLKYLLHDPDNSDFRIRQKFADWMGDIGPYPYQEKMTEYWIPGRILYKTSSPVPPTHSATVNRANRDALMWLNAWECSKHHVYFSNDKESVSNASGTESDCYVGSAEEGGNVVYLGEELEGLVTYYWRVDAVREDGGVIRGDVWDFTTLG